MKTSMRLCLLSSVGAVCLWTSAASAQQSAQQGGLEEIVVTAQRREERLQDVPVSITAFTGENLQSSHVVDTRSLMVSVPNVSMAGSINGANDMIITMRGVGPGTFNPNTDTAVGIYVDGVYYARGQGSNLGLIDVERLEVLRGPQGTLFGRNTIGGAINITTNRPKDDFEGSIKIGAGNYKQFGATAILNVPLVTDKLSIRGIYDRQQHAGYGYNTLLRVDQSDLYQDYMRLSILEKFSDSVELLVTGDHMRSHANAEFWISRFYDPTIAAANARTAAAPFTCTGKCRSGPTDVNWPNLGKVDSVNATLTADLGFGTFKSISSWREIDFPGGGDQDGTPIRFVGTGYSVNQRQYSQEAQIYGKALDNKLDWIGGLYYFAEKISNASPVQTTVAGVPLTVDNNWYGRNTSKSAFAQVSYEVIPKVKLTGGVRYVEDTRRASYYQVTLLNPVGPAGGTVAPLVLGGATILAACRQPAPTAIGLTGPVDPVNCKYYPAGTKAHYVPWTVGVDFKATDDMLFYGKVSQGFRSGGFQLASAIADPFGYTPFGPEKVISGEAGTKLDLLDNHLRVNGAGFYTHYTSIQQNLPQVNPVLGTALPIFANVGVLDIKGIELEVTALLGDLKLTGNLGLLDPKFKSTPFNVIPLVASNPIFVSKTTWSLAADYPVHLEKGVLTFHLDYGWESRNFNYVPANVNVAPFTSTPAGAVPGSATGPLTQGQIDSFTTPALGLLNGSIAFALDKPDVTVTMWGRNLTNKYIFYRCLSTYNVGYNACHPNDPLTFGATVGYKF